MKATIRIPTVQFGYVELEVQPNPEVSARPFQEVVIELHNEMVALYKASLPKADTNNNDDDF